MPTDADIHRVEDYLKRIGSPPVDITNRTSDELRQKFPDAFVGEAAPVAAAPAPKPMLQMDWSNTDVDPQTMKRRPMTQEELAAHVPQRVQRAGYPFLESKDLLAAPDQLRERAQHDGYLFVHDVVNHDSVLRLRRDVTNILQNAGWLDDDTDPMDAISTIDAKVMGTPEFNPIYDTIQRLESFHTMAHNKELLEIAESLLGEPGMPQPGTRARVMFASGIADTTPPHQDFIFVQGRPEVWTCWIPLGACPHSMGGLAVLRGSHKRGVLPVFQVTAAGALSIEADALDGDWHSSPFELGDALFFHSKTAHQGLPNVSGDRVRLSVDYRYQKKTDLIMEKNLGVHGGRLTWEQVYENWESDELQYYWKGNERETVPMAPPTEFK